MVSKGAKLLTAKCARSLFLPSLVYGILSFIQNHLTWRIRFGILTLTVLLESFVLAAINARRQRRLMQRLGAQEPPKVLSTLPGGLSILYDLVLEEREGYQGCGSHKWCQDLNSDIVQLTLLGNKQIFTYNPDYIKRVLATEFENFEKGATFKGLAESVLGTGIFNADDELWKFHRSITRPFFSRERISDFNIFQLHANHAIAKLKQRTTEGEAVDFQDLAFRFTMDTATEFLLGSCVNSLDSELPYAYNSSRPMFKHASHPSNEFAESFHRAQSRVYSRIKYADNWPLWEILGDKTAQDVTKIMSFVDPIIQNVLRAKGEDPRRLEGPEETGPKNFEDETLLSHLVKMTDSREVIRDEVINIMVAGRDTTAATLTFAVYMLTQHQEVVTKLREEVMRTVGASRPPTLEDIRSMKYLRAFVNETLRLFPPVPNNVRRTKRATTFPSQKPGERPWFIPAKTNIILSFYHMHRSDELWGPTALHFDPDRFMDERVTKYLIGNPFIFLPFNAGPRICLGQQFAYNEASFFIIRLIQSFSSFSLDSNAQPPDSLPREHWKRLAGRAAVEKVYMKANLTMSVKGGLWVRMTESDDSHSGIYNDGVQSGEKEE